MKAGVAPPIGETPLADVAPSGDGRATDDRPLGEVEELKLDDWRCGWALNSSWRAMAVGRAYDVSFYVPLSTMKKRREKFADVPRHQSLPCSLPSSLREPPQSPLVYWAWRKTDQVQHCCVSGSAL